MKKIMSLALGLAFLTGTAATCFGQETPKKQDQKKSTTQKKGEEKGHEGHDHKDHKHPPAR